MLISEAFKAYTEDVISFRNQSWKTEESHYIVMKSLIGFLGDIPIESLTFPMIRDWKIYLEPTRSPLTVRMYIIRLRVVLGYLKIAGVGVISVEQVPVPQRVERVPAFLTKAQVAQCIRATQRIKNKAIVSLLYSSGIRISELCALNRDVYHNNCFSVIGKGGKARLCFIDERTQDLIKQYYDTRTDNNPAAFLSDSGHRITPSAIQATFRTIHKQTGFSVHPHTLRHSFATNLLQTNTNLYHVSKMLGHRQLNTTASYLHVIDPDLEKVYKEHHTF